MTGLSAADARELRFYCGCYTTELGHVDGQGEAIGIYALDDAGAMRRVGQSPPIANSSHLCLSAQGRFLYSISEITDYQGVRDGSVTVFAVDPSSGALESRQTVSSHGPGPAYVSIDPSGRFLLLANYAGGNVVVFPIGSDGLLGTPTANVKHAGKSVNPERQEAPHPHAIVASPDGRFVYVPDLGLDRVVAYRLDASTGALAPAPELDARTPPGSGPRHLAFAPSGEYAYLALELSSEAAALAYADGRLTEVARCRTTPGDFQGANSCAEVRVAPDGRYVYVSNRGHDSLAALAVDAATGGLELVQVVSTQGKVPRNFGISPNGRWVVAANQNSHTLVSFRRDADTGKLAPTGAVLESPSPVLICFCE